jgi:hypothetical protein
MLTISYIFINWKVKEVKLVLIVYCELFKQSLLGVFVGNVFHHHRGPPITFNIGKLNQISSGLLNGDRTIISNGPLSVKCLRPLANLQRSRSE